jgi:hypothetical protein
MTISRMVGPFGIGVNAILKLRLRGTTEASKLLLGLGMSDVLILYCGLGGLKGRRLKRPPEPWQPYPPSLWYRGRGSYTCGLSGWDLCK